jgi:hypothetical protein
MEYKDYDQINNARKSMQRGLRFAYYIHAQLIMPQMPILYKCGGCGRPIFEANTKTIEIDNGFGAGHESLKTSDHWIRLKCHSCGAHISILFK